ncbi:Crp/Fnr family transcriptional regulator [Kangiella spongicola]|uniref:Crp/Fnr family transcriptional regulator n=1 Tax=Kangiella spongicola TaxID=796379 RepID=A0A318D2Z6_9GAMM|nr:Crp/Fnr family transcriptional regulator [Kangiella spongicola]PXF63646.1 Crp/Fnr family transcriptional regulator [Kangiella spongicola]
MHDSVIKQHTALIRKSFLLQPLPEKALDELLANSKINDFNREDIIINQGQSAQHFFLVLKGQLKLTLLSSEGKEKIVKFVDAGDTFAEAIMFLQGKHYPISAISTKKSTVLSIPNEQYYKLLSGNSELCMKMLGNICLKMRGHVNEIEMLTILDASQRVLKFFYDLMPCNIKNGESYPVTMSKKLIASKLSMRAETFSRILKRFEEQQIFAFNQHQILVLDRDKMADFQAFAA